MDKQDELALDEGSNEQIKNFIPTVEIESMLAYIEVNNGADWMDTILKVRTWLDTIEPINSQKKDVVSDMGEVNGTRLTYVNGNVFATPKEKMSKCMRCGNPMPRNEIRCKVCHP